MESIYYAILLALLPCWRTAVGTLDLRQKLEHAAVEAVSTSTAHLSQQYALKREVTGLRRIFRNRSLVPRLWITGCSFKGRVP